VHRGLCGNEKHQIQPQIVQRDSGIDKVPEVHRIEGSAQYTEPQDRT